MNSNGVKNMYDLIIIGGGPAGLTAGIYAMRSQLKTLLLEKMIPGGQVLTTYEVENYPGFAEKILGQTLMDNMEKQARNLGLEIKLEDVTDVELEPSEKIITTSEATYKAKSVIIATGASPRSLQINGEKEFTGRGVSYCATCDGFFFKNKEIAIVGGGNTALEEALYLSNIVSKVTLIHRRDEFRAVKILQERVFNNKKIDILFNSIVVEITGDKKANTLKIKNVKTEKIKDFIVDGLFISIGLLPNTSLFENKLLFEDGFIKSDEEMRTSIAGVFAAGDVRSKSVRQIVTAAADGAIAALTAEKYLESLRD